MMKAVFAEQYGSPEHLRVVDHPTPVIGDTEVLVRVHAAGLHVGLLQPQAVISFKHGANGDEDFAAPERDGHSMAENLRKFAP